MKYDVFQATITIVIEHPHKLKPKDVQWLLNQRSKSLLIGAKTNITDFKILGIEAED